MYAEQIEIAVFLKQHLPFSRLAEEVVSDIAAQIEIRYFRAGANIFKFGDEIHDFCVIRSGAIEVYRRNGNLYNRLSEGDTFGQMSLLMNNKVRLPALALEDSLIYFIPESLFIELCDLHESFAYFVEMEDNSLHQAVSSKHESNELMVSKATDLIARKPVCLEVTATVQQAAKKMAAEEVSSIMVMHQIDKSEYDDNEPQLAGIVTDRDLRVRVVATGLDLNSPVTSIMTTEPVTLDEDAYAFEAMLLMLRFNLQHLPILDNGYPIGVLATSDIVRYESQSSLYMVSTILRQQSVDELVSIAPDIKACFLRMVKEDANSHMIGSAMSVIGRCFKQQLLKLAEEKLGKSPIPYCYLALGSMARDEQLITTDQDNALILDNSYDPELHGEYFEQLTAFVSDGLNACGYIYCTGNVMATNPQWRKTRKEWEACFADWIDNPNPDALLNCSIFFDLEGVAGKTEWANQLNIFIVRRAKRAPLFLASLARNALSRTAPLGFFKDFVMEKDGQHRNSINLKRRGTAPLSDLIRVHALAVGSRAQNSFERLDDITKTSILPKGREADIRDALEFISMVRIRHQALDIEAGNIPDNSIEPENLSDFERRNLKEAFQVINNSQRFLRFRYPYTGR